LSLFLSAFPLPPGTLSWRGLCRGLFKTHWLDHIARLLLPLLIKGPANTDAGDGGFIVSGFW
jgi:hypothetical protein